jgi:IS1 family transposase
MRPRQLDRSRSRRYNPGLPPKDPCVTICVAAFAAGSVIVGASDRTLTWTAMDADTKLIVSWYVGRRGLTSARRLISDLHTRLVNRVQLTTDGYRAYPDAVEESFGGDVDFAVLVKSYAATQAGAGRHSPPVCTGAEKIPQWDRPDFDHVSTSMVERQNLTMRMGMRRLTRLTNGYSKKVENHAAAVALHFMHYTFCRPHTTLTQDHPHHYPITPAMAAGVADHVWTVEEVCGS